MKQYLFIIAIIITTGIITPMNTGNPLSTEQSYCGFGERDNCETIPQNIPISINDIKRLEL